MSSSAGNLLIVEDDKEWCAAYERAAAREGMHTVKVAKNLRDADALINDLQFAVAFIDVGLNVSDDQNVDGVRVMSKIRDIGDETSIVVVTGRSGRDVIPITRDAIRKYEAHEILRKSEIQPQDIRKLIHGGMAEFQKKMSARHSSAHQVLMGNMPSWQWEDEMLRITDAKGGIQVLYALLEGLLTEFLPLVPPDSAADSFTTGTAEGFAHGSFWSRSVGKPVAIFFGSQDSADEQIDSATAGGTLLGRYPIDSLLKRSAGHGLSGGVFSLTTPRDAFMKI
jgi:ActR/RegA family two-component response regulator